MLSQFNITFDPNLKVNPADLGIRDGVTTAIGLPQITQLDKPRPVGEFVRYRGTDLQSQPGLPDPPGPAKRQRTRHAHQPVQLVELALTADETILFVGQIGRNLLVPLS